VNSKKGPLWARMRFLAAWFGLCLVLAPVALHAGQEVRVFVVADEEGRLADRSAVLEQALQSGVFQEAEALLRGRLPKARQGLLREVLAGKAPEYVLGFSSLAPETTAWGAVLHFDVHVNRQALRDFLQAIGLYYTLDRPVGYVLEAKGLSIADAAMVANMETLSGLQRGKADSPTLRLSRTLDQGWQGRLDFEGLVWSAQAPDLSRLWASLWGNYFALDRVRQGFAQRVLLTTRGWPSAVAVQDFDQVLRGWNLEAGEVRMISMSLGSLGGQETQAKWEILTMDRVGLEAGLKTALQDRQIQYVLALP